MNESDKETLWLKGDRVEYKPIGRSGYPWLIGKWGTVLENSDAPFIEWDEYIGGNNGAGLGKNGYCWAVYGQDLREINNEEKTKESSITQGRRLKSNGLILAGAPVNLLPNPDNYRKWQRGLIIIPIILLLIPASIIGWFFYLIGSAIRFWEKAFERQTPSPTKDQTR